MIQTYPLARIYIDSAGDFIVQVGQYDDIHPTGPDWYYIDDVVPEEALDIVAFCHWIADECPDSEFPSELTDAEIEEIRQDTRNSRWYGEDGFTVK